MTKDEIATEIARATGLEKRAVLLILEAFKAKVKESLANDENVYLRRFGSFVIKNRAEKTARNITQNIMIKIPASKKPVFKPSRELKNAVAKLGI